MHVKGCHERRELKVHVTSGSMCQANLSNEVGIKIVNLLCTLVQISKTCDSAPDEHVIRGLTLQ
jgi:hypothetical protein